MNTKVRKLLKKAEKGTLRLKPRKLPFNAKITFMGVSPSGICLYALERHLSVSCPICGLVMLPVKEKLICIDCGIVTKW